MMHYYGAIGRHGRTRPSGSRWFTQGNIGQIQVDIVSPEVVYETEGLLGFALIQGLGAHLPQTQMAISPAIHRYYLDVRRAGAFGDLQGERLA